MAKSEAAFDVAQSLIAAASRGGHPPCVVRDAIELVVNHMVDTVDETFRVELVGQLSRSE